jgi:hypothetical protein
MTTLVLFLILVLAASLIGVEICRTVDRANIRRENWRDWRSIARRNSSRSR